MTKRPCRTFQRHNMCSSTINAKSRHLPMGHAITAELWSFAIKHAATIYNTTKRISRDCDLSPCEQFTGECSKLDQTDMHPLLCPVYVLDQ
jgi:hypothetical protein